MLPGSYCGDGCISTKMWYAMGVISCDPNLVMKFGTNKLLEWMGYLPNFAILARG